MPKNRPKRFVPYTFAAYPSLLKELRQIAHDNNISVSQFIRDAIVYYQPQCKKGKN